MSQASTTLTKRYHLHLYFDLTQATDALTLYRDAWNALSKAGVRFAGIHPVSIGPHPKPMFELNFSEIILTQVKSFFKNKTTYSILIHTDTECDIKDHTVGAEWLGEPLQLNFNFFEKIINDPDSRIHPIQKL